MAQTIFVVLSLITLGCALVVVTNRNLFHSALFLAFVFVGVAGLYFMLQAEFFAGIQVLIYVGAILTLIIFAIMLSRDLMNPTVRGFNRQWWAAALVAGLLFVTLAVVLWRAPWPAVPVGEPSPALITELGQALVSPAYVLPFEVVSILLLAALVGSILIARER